MRWFHIWIFIFNISAAFTQSLMGQELNYQMVRVAEGVYVFIPNEQGVGNSTVVISEEDVLVVDTGISPSGALNMISQIRKLTAKPVRYIVNTHWHDDHIWGNQAYRTAFPGVEFIAHINTRKDMLTLAVPELAQNIENLRAKITEREAILKRGTDSDNQPISEERRLSLEKRQEMFKSLYHDFKTIEPMPPSLTFEDSLILFRGGVEIRILHLGRGNTRGDLVIHIPAKKVLITGDLLTHPIPAAAGAFMIDWIATMKKLALLDAETIVPGHGPIMRDKEYMTLVTNLLESVVSQVREAIGQNMSLDSTLEFVNVTEFKKQIVKNDARLSRGFDMFFLRPAIESAYQKLTGGNRN